MTTRVFVSEKGGRGVRVRDGSRGQRDVIPGSEDQRGPQTRECELFLEAAKGKDGNSLSEPPESTTAQPTP